MMRLGTQPVNIMAKAVLRKCGSAGKWFALGNATSDRVSIPKTTPEVSVSRLRVQRIAGQSLCPDDATRRKPTFEGRDNTN